MAEVRREMAVVALVGLAVGLVAGATTVEVGVEAEAAVRGAWAVGAGSMVAVTEEVVTEEVVTEDRTGGGGATSPAAAVTTTTSSENETFDLSQARTQPSEDSARWECPLQKTNLRR